MLTLSLKVIGLTAIAVLFSVTIVTPPHMMAAYAQLQLNADTICVLNPDQCDEARQQEFNDAIQRGMQEQFAEDYRERTGEEPPTTDELMEGVEQEGDFDDERLANEAADNGIPDMQNMPSATIFNRPDEQITKAELLDATFSNLLKSTEQPGIETIQEAVDMDEDDIERQILQYEFAEDNDADNIGIYTLPNETVQSLATAITGNGNATDIELFENGRMIITYEGAESFDEADDTMIYAPHNYTAAAGYVYDNSTIYEPDGSELFENAQTSSSSSSSSTTAAAGGTEAASQSTYDNSFKVQVPPGWVIQDLDNTDSALLEESTRGYGLLAQLCPEEEQQGAVALPNVSGSSAASSSTATSTSNCLGAEEVIYIIRYPDLDTRIPAANTITTGSNELTSDNILSYHLQKLQEVGYTSIQIVNSTDATVNLANSQTDETIATAPAKLVEITYSTNSAPNEIRTGYFISTATDATPPVVGTTKGYSVFYEGSSTPLPPAVGQVFDSFELIAASEVAPLPTTPAAPTAPPSTPALPITPLTPVL